MFTLTTLQSTPTWLTSLCVFILIIASYFVGIKIRNKRIRLHPDFEIGDTGKMGAILIGLLSFLLAFTFGMANSRYDKRKDLIVQEANDIGTAFLRTKILPDSIQKLTTPAFNEYLEARIAFSTEKMDVNRLVKEYYRADSIGKSIWNIIADYSQERDGIFRISQLMPALNAMIDITNTRRLAGESTIPDSIMYFLFILAFCSSFLLGYESKGRVDWAILGTFSVMISFTIFTIIDLDRPRSGLINMDVATQKLIELKGTFN